MADQDKIEHGHTMGKVNRKELKSAEAAKDCAIKQVDAFNLQPQAGADCSGAICAFAAGIGCAVGCAVGGGTTIAFGALGGSIGGSGTAIATTQSRPDTVPSSLEPFFRGACPTGPPS